MRMLTRLLDAILLRRTSAGKPEPAYHFHRCDMCAFVWRHVNESQANNFIRHECPRCGVVQFDIYLPNDQERAELAKLPLRE